MARYLKKVLQDSASLRQRLLGSSPFSRPASSCSSPNIRQLSSAIPRNFREFFSPATDALWRFHGASKYLRSRTFSSLCASPPVRRTVVEMKHAKALRGRRYYYVDGRGYQHFKSKGLRSWLQSPDGKDKFRLCVTIFVAIGGCFAVIYVTHLEVVPYTYRRHFVLIPPPFEVRLVDDQFQALKKQWKALILPSIHPQTIRVRRIAKDIIQAVMEGAKTDGWGELEISDGRPYSPEENGRDLMVWKEGEDLSSSAESFWAKPHPHEHVDAKNDTLNDSWIEESREKGLKGREKPFTEHLNLMKWEVLVVDQDIVNAFCLPGGKIVVFTGLLKRFNSDAEIATVLGHEVGHVVARHSAERLTQHLFLTIAQLFVLAFFYAPDLVRSVSALFLELPFSRRQELEADHIGLLLMAAAGYDPRVAPGLYEKLGELSGASDLLQYVTTHPSGRKRGERLKKTGTMEQAVKIYLQKTQGKNVEGFL